MKLFITKITDTAIHLQGEDTIENGFIRNGRMAFVNGSQEQIKRTVKKYNLAEGIDFNEATGMNLAIEVKEQVGEPFYTNQEPKRAGTNGDVLTKNGKPIYRRTNLVKEDQVNDEFVEHDKVEQTQKIKLFEEQLEASE